MDAHCDLARKHCVPCKGGVPPLKGEALARLHRQLGNGWTITDEHYLEKEYAFRNFREALAFTHAVGAIAEQEGHHPDIFLSYGKVKIRLWTHKIDGLSESDFILAAKCDLALVSPPQQAPGG
jgi:4a-hydroxytetrahydrobiopterin dehydratase